MKQKLLFLSVSFVLLTTLFVGCKKELFNEVSFEQMKDAIVEHLGFDEDDIIECDGDDENAEFMWHDEFNHFMTVSNAQQIRMFEFDSEEQARALFEDECESMNTMLEAAVIPNMDNANTAEDEDEDAGKAYYVIYAEDGAFCATYLSGDQVIVIKIVMYQDFDDEITIEQIEAFLDELGLPSC